MSLSSRHPNDAKPSYRFGCGTILLLALFAGLAAFTYFLRPRWGVIWQAATGPLPQTAAPSPPAAERRVLYWTCSMHPEYRSDKPGICPICKMDLSPVYAEAAETKPEAGAVTSGNLPENAFRITPDKQQLIGVQYGEASIQPLSKTVRAVGRLAYNETGITHVHSKVAGWVDQVYAHSSGEMVRHKQPLLTIYSPELLATQEEYLLALKARDQLGGSPIREVSSGAASLLEAARRRLEFWDMTEEQISQLEKTRKTSKAVTLYSTATGIVLTRNAYERQRVTPETELYTLADLSTIWVIADVYEFDTPLVRIGQGISVTLPALPGRKFFGKVSFIYPQVDVASRTLKVRAELPNPDSTLKPDMYASVDLAVHFGRVLSVPAEAVLNSGSEQIVFVALDGGYFEPRKIQMGERVENRIVILGGLKPGERIVTSGNFLIDSESRLKSTTSDLNMPSTGSGNKPTASSAPTAMDHSARPHDRQAGAAKPDAGKTSEPNKPEPHKHD